MNLRYGGRGSSGDPMYSRVSVAMDMLISLL
jgi:hypothetical protein